MVCSNKFFEKSWVSDGTAQLIGFVPLMIIIVFFSCDNGNLLILSLSRGCSSSCLYLLSFCG